MPLDQSFVGRGYPPHPLYQVAREKIREFAEAIGATDPIHHDVEAARAAGYPDVVAPATFLTIIATAANRQVVLDPGLGVDVGGGDVLSLCRAVGDRAEGRELG